jgi:HK97 family phage prohead protease
MTMTDSHQLVHTRAFEDAALDMRDGRLTGRLVPYDEPALVLDTLADGSADIYMEGFRKGAFDRLLRDPKGNAGRLEFKHRHDGGLGYLGPGVELEERDDGMYGTFQIVRTRRDDVADLLAAGHRGLSIEFRELAGGTVEEDDVRWRTDVAMSGVALEWRGAYSQAEVMAYRSEIESEQSERAEADAVERKRAEEEAAVAAAEQAKLDEAAARLQRQRDVDDWLVEQERRQAELAAKYG